LQESNNTFELFCEGPLIGGRAWYCITQATRLATTHWINTL